MIKYCNRKFVELVLVVPKLRRYKQLSREGAKKALLHQEEELMFAFRILDLQFAMYLRHAFLFRTVN